MGAHVVRTFGEQHVGSLRPVAEEDQHRTLTGGGVLGRHEPRELVSRDRVCTGAERLEPGGQLRLLLLGRVGRHGSSVPSRSEPDAEVLLDQIGQLGVVTDDGERDLGDPAVPVDEDDPGKTADPELRPQHP